MHSVFDFPIPYTFTMAAVLTHDPLLTRLSEVEKVQLNCVRDWVKVLGCDMKINRSLLGGSMAAQYNPETDQILLHPLAYFTSVTTLLHTVIHELIHATGHSTRLNRLQFNPSYYHLADYSSYAEEEVIADLGACMVMEKIFPEHAVETVAHSAQYIAHYRTQLREYSMNGLASTMVVEDLPRWESRAEQAAWYLLERVLP